MLEDYYSILGLSASASSEEIRAAYRELAKKYHPDKHKGDPNFEEKFKRVSAAYDTLSDPEKKRIYDDRRAYYAFHETVRSSATSETFYESPRPRHSGYYEDKREYTPTAWMFGKIVIFLIISLAILFPFSIFYFSSVFNYEEGLEHEENGDYISALNAYNRSISFWGGRNLEACLKAGEILLNQGAALESISYFREAYDYTNSDSLGDFLHFRIAQAHYALNRSEYALNELDSISNDSPYADSVQILTARIHTFGTREFRKGIEDYRKLISNETDLRDSWFGIGWCHQHLFQYPEAINAYTRCVELDPEFAMALFYRGSAYYYSNDSIRACTDFHRARDLGYEQAATQFSIACQDSINSFVPPREN